MARINTELRRKPCCAVLDTGEQRYLIDAGLMDLSDRYPAGSLAGIFLTHFHVEHVQGLFHLRWGKGRQMSVYCPNDSKGCADLYKHPGILQFYKLHKLKPITLGKLTITPLPLIHSKPTLGYLFEYEQQRIAYLTDTAGLPDKTRHWLQQHKPHIIVLDCSHPPRDNPPRNHNDLNLALGIHNTLQPYQTVLTHISDEMDTWAMDNPDALPPEVKLARDGMAISV